MHPAIYAPEPAIGWIKGRRFQRLRFQEPISFLRLLPRAKSNSVWSFRLEC
jgi:hypothetical protein